MQGHLASILNQTLQEVTHSLPRHARRFPRHTQRTRALLFVFWRTRVVSVAVLALDLPVESVDNQLSLLVATDFSSSIDRVLLAVEVTRGFLATRLLDVPTAPASVVNDMR